jgi:hypothetical protein
MDLYIHFSIHIHGTVLEAQGHLYLLPYIHQLLEGFCYKLYLLMYVFKNVLTKQVALMLRRCLVLLLAGTLAIMTEVFNSFPQFFQANVSLWYEYYTPYKRSIDHITY